MTPNNKRLISAGLDSNTSDGRQFNVSASVMNKQIKSITPMQTQDGTSEDLTANHLSGQTKEGETISVHDENG